MTGEIGYYVHHHGDGHRQRAVAIARAARLPITLLGTGLAGRGEGSACVDLPDDRLPGGGFDGADGAERPAALHYAPVDHDGIRRRVAMISGWIADVRPRLMVIDVSVEVAMLARLASVPTVYVRLSGRRLDRPHLEAYRSARVLLAPFHADLDDDRTPTVIRHKTFYAPGILSEAPMARGQSEDILGVVGRGGGAADGDRWADAARAVPERRWRVIGPCTVPRDPPENLDLLGWVDDSAAMIARAGIVVGAGGDGLVGSVIAARRPFVCIPEERPFGEQVSKAARLAAVGAAVVSPVWPAARDWPVLIARAAALDPQRLAALDCRDGTARTADWLCDLAESTQPDRAVA